MDRKKTARRTAEPRVMFAVRVPVDIAKRVRLRAERWGIPPTAAATKLISIGLDAEAGTLDQDAEIRSIGGTLSAIADRLDCLDKFSEVTVRAALKAGMCAIRQIEASAGASEVLRRLDAAVEKTIEEIRK